jgi:hypothetical protein
MANGSSRVLPVILSLVVGFAVGWLIRSQVGLPPAAKKGTSAIVVGPKAKDLTIPELHLSRSNQDVAFWVSKDKAKKLYIEFTEELFENMQRQPNNRFRVDCKGRHCYSDEIKEGAAYKNYKYWQILDDGSGHPDEADGMIIIDP